MRVALAVVVPLLAALIQAAIVPLVAPAELRPNLPLLAAASWAVAVGFREATWWAFLGGVALDLLSAGPLGAFALAMLPPVALVGAGERPLLRPIPVVTGVFLVGVAALIAGSVYVVILALIGVPLPDPAQVVTRTLGGAAVTAVLAIAAYPLARAIRRVSEADSPF